MYEECKLYGPYNFKKDGRLRAILVYPNGKKKLISYPKYIYEKYFNVELKEDETIDHIDSNPLNNNIDNLRVVKRTEHAYNDVLRNKDVIYKCDMCGEIFTIKGKDLRNRTRKDRKNTAHFCSRKCAGKYNALRQHNKIDSIKGKEIIIEKENFHNKFKPQTNN